MAVHEGPVWGQKRLFLLAYGASGAAALIYEVTWTRLLALHMGHNIAAASTVLAAFMGGLAMLERESGNLRAAAQRYAEALTLNPKSEVAGRGFAEVTALPDP